MTPINAESAGTRSPGSAPVFSGGVSDTSRGERSTGDVLSGRDIREMKEKVVFGDKSHCWAS